MSDTTAVNSPAISPNQDAGEVLDHRVFFILPFTYDTTSLVDSSAKAQMKAFVNELQNLTVGDFDKAMEQSPLKDRFTKPMDERKLWPRPKALVAKDLIPAVQNLVGKVDKDAGICPDSCLTVALTGDSELLFHSKDRRVFQVKKKNKGDISVSIETPSIFVFVSGVGILVLPVSYAPNKPEGAMGTLLAKDILFGNYQLTHPSNDNDKHQSAETITNTAISDIACALLPKRTAQLVPNGRYFVYSALRISRNGFDGDDAVLLAHRLSHRQNEDYAPTKEVSRNGKIRLFDYLTHSAAIEGGATIIVGDETEFQKQYIRNQINNTYLPLLITEIHSRYWLLHRTTSLSVVHPAHGDETDSDNLKLLNRRLLNFRRYCHYPYPSELTNHNEFHALWQSVFGIERLLNSLAETVKEVSEEARKDAEETRKASEETRKLADEERDIVRKAADAEHEKRSERITIFSSALASMIGVQQILEVWRDLELDNTFVWQSRLFVERNDLIRGAGVEPLSAENAQRLQQIDAAIAATTELATTWEIRMALGSVAGAAIGLAIAWFIRRHK